MAKTKLTRDQKNALEVAELFKKNGFLDVTVDLTTNQVVARQESKWHSVGLLTTFRRDEDL